MHASLSGHTILEAETDLEVERQAAKASPSQVQWLTPVIPALSEAKVSRSLEVRSSRPAWAT